MKLRVADKAGNMNEVASSWNIDPTYPYISLTGKPDAFVKDSEVSFSFEVLNGLSFNQFECQFGSESSFSPCASGVKYSVFTDGQYAFKVRAKDPQGYFTSSLSYQFYRDATAPKIKLVSPESAIKSINSLVIAVNIDDGENGSGVASVVCYLESLVNSDVLNRTISSCSFPLDLSAELTGEYYLTVVASDKLGSQATSEGFQFIYVNEERNPAVRGTLARRQAWASWSRTASSGTRIGQRNSGASGFVGAGLPPVLQPRSPKSARSSA